MPHEINELQALLQDALAHFRPQFTEGISEYELIRALKCPPYMLFDEGALSDPLMMFQTHFVLFHCLYQLRKEWREQEIGELDIGLSQITLCPMLHSCANIQIEDPLAKYYADWGNLSSTNGDDVEALLNSFWLKMAGNDLSASMTDSERKSACAILEIDSLNNTNLLELKHKYKKLQHKNHPDKGGCIKVSQSILQAYTQLRRYLNTHG